MAELSRIRHPAAPPDDSHTQQMLEVVYDALRHLAHQRMRGERAEFTLQATALVHEAYLRLLDYGRNGWNDPSHFYRAAAETMRRILIDRARRRARLRHGGNLVRVSLEEAECALDQPPEQLLALDRALSALEVECARKAEVVKLRYFVGFSIEETAKQLGVSPATVKLDWAFARAWLKKHMRDA